MTQKALSVNKEWNTKVISTAEGEMYQNVSSAFEKLWNDKNHTQAYSDFIEEYRTKYETIKKQRKIALEAARNAAEEDGGSSQVTATKTGVVSLEQYKLKPNSMQVDFINNLSKLIDAGENKFLLVSATGTGKTYASAFGLRDALNRIGANKRVLFIVHREQIAKQLGSPKAMDRMLAYLYNVKPRTAELIVDEMLAICSDVDNWHNKKAAEEANARYNEILYYGIDKEETKNG